MLLELGTEPFFSSSGWIFAFNAAANQVSSVFLDTPVVDGQSTYKDGHLEREIDNDAETGHQAEVLQSRHIGEKAYEEGNALAQRCGEDRRSNFLHSETDSLIDGCDSGWNLALGPSDQEHVIDADS